MTALPRFSILSLCAKCGAQDASCRHRKASVLDAGQVLWASPEAVVRTCPRCHFSWDEAPLDAPSPQMEHAP